MLFKLKIVMSALDAGVNIFYLDSDIVGLEDPWYQTDAPIIAQSNAFASGKREEICTGCLLMKPSAFTKKLMD